MGRNGIAGIGVLEQDQFRMIRDSDGLAHNEMFSLYNDGKKCGQEHLEEE